MKMKKEFEDSPFEYIEWLEQENRKLREIVESVPFEIHNEDGEVKMYLDEKNCKRIEKALKQK